MFARDEADRSGRMPFAVTAEEAQTIIALTYGMISMIDDAIGRILAALDRAGHARYAVVIFTSDHCDYFGDHGIILKFLLHYQGLVRVPFLWADPASERRGAARADLRGTLDLPRTILGPRLPPALRWHARPGFVRSASSRAGKHGGRSA
jgi:arylsulfatase A-like enzyme